ncbi:MAG: GC-type dockerin domain-anchored protein [Planctomycetota bacterium]|nr:GC-type dockerin domain-anchored protein [Planctomycetota bacterium]
MNLTHRLALTVAACGLATSAMAQDSVSPAGVLPGDALEVYDAAESCNAYVVDATGFLGSWGTPLQIAPVVKGPRMPLSGFFNNLISAQAISHDMIEVADYPSATYQLWSTPGAGINDLINTAPGSVSPSGMSMQMALGFADFGTSAEGSNYNGITAAVVNVDPANESRFYVTRVSTAVNGADGFGNTAQFGFGVIDANGNAHFRADDFGVSGPNPITGNNIFRVNILSRTCGTLNVIDNAGASDAGDWLVANSATTHPVPNALAESTAGRPVYGGMNFNSQYAYEVAPGVVVASGAYLQGAATSRGTNGVSLRPWFSNPDAVATHSVLSKTVNPGPTDAISVWDVDNNGNVLNPGALLVMPAAPGQSGMVTDNSDGFFIEDDINDPDDGWALDGYLSQTPFRGGTGSVALAVAPNGDRLAATTAYNDLIGGSNNPANAVVVAKHDPATGTTVWTLAGYYDAITDTGKVVKDGPGGATIGVMSGLFEVTGGDPLGPSIGQPAIDCAGNVYFVAAVELFGDLGSDFDVALLRAVYDEATFSYELELIATSGDVYMGNNSGTPYAITFIDIADFNSLSSGGFFGSNVTGDCWAGTAQSDLDGATDPRALGGLVLNARITYDTDGDGFFDNAFDENYRTALLITGTGAADPCGYADYNNDNAVNTQDVIAFLNDWNAGNAGADCNQDSNVNTQDVICFLNLWNACR